MNLWLDDDRDPVKFGYLGYVWVKTVEEAKKLLMTGEVEKASLDHDLGLCDECLKADTAEKIRRVRENLIRNDGCASYCSCSHIGTGYQLVCWMEETGNWPKEKPNVHSANTVGRMRMQQAIDREWRRREEEVLYGVSAPRF